MSESEYLLISFYCYLIYCNRECEYNSGDGSLLSLASLILNDNLLVASPSAPSLQPARCCPIGQFGTAPSSRTSCGALHDPAVHPERPPLAALGQQASGLTTPTQATCTTRSAAIDANNRECGKAKRQRPGQRSETVEKVLGQQRQAMARLVEIQRQIAATLQPTRRGCKDGSSRRAA